MIRTGPAQVAFVVRSNSDFLARQLTQAIRARFKRSVTPRSRGRTIAKYNRPRPAVGVLWREPFVLKKAHCHSCSALASIPSVFFEIAPTTLRLT